MAFLGGDELGVASRHKLVIVDEDLGLVPGKAGDQESGDFGPILALALVMACQGCAEYLSRNTFCGAWARPEGESPGGLLVLAGAKQALWNGASPGGNHQLEGGWR